MTQSSGCLAPRDNTAWESRSPGRELAAESLEPTADSSEASELLEGATGFRVVASGQAVGPGDLTDVDVTLGVRRDAVRRDECARGAAIGAAPTQQHVSGEIEHEDAARQVVLPTRPSHVCGPSRPPQGG